MLAIEWHRGAARVHERVLEGALDTLSMQVAHLHRPVYSDGEYPTCHGCDSDGTREEAPTWPCRTYTILAKVVLNLQDVEATMMALGQLRR